MLKVKLLGQFEISVGEKRVQISSRPAQSLFAFLLLHAGKAYRREKLAGLFWPEATEANARNSLRQALWLIRKGIGETHFSADKLTVAFTGDGDRSFWLDAHILEEADADDASKESLEQAVGVYEGELLPGFYDEWILLERERLNAVYERQMHLLLQLLVQEEQWQGVLQWAQQWLAHGQVPEAAYRAIMRAHYAQGNRSGVASIYQACVHALDAEMGLEPSEETETLYRQLSQGNGPAILSSAKADSRPRVLLPAPPTPFVGRVEELSQLHAKLLDPNVRLLTLLGPGGIGKTRLAIEAANRLGDSFADGIFFVPLASLDDPVGVISAIADSLGYSFHVRDQREHWEVDTELKQLLAYLRDKQVLILLDNAEHLLAAALPDLAEWKLGIEGVVSEVIQAAPSAKVMVTSRETLNLRGDTVVSVGGLSLDPSPDPAMPNAQGTDGGTGTGLGDALRLFVECAERARPGFKMGAGDQEAVLDICTLVEGMPLGIELAAAWAPLLSPAEIVEEIRNGLDFLETSAHDVPIRQRSMRAVFESTRRRLSPTEQELFQQLSVFRGGFTREAAQVVAGASLPLLMVLVRKSLIRPDFRGRYHIHELLRHFGSQRLAQHPDAERAARDRHCTYFARFLDQRDLGLSGRKHGAALSEISVELDNVRRAWSWAVSELKLEEIELAMESLCEFYRIRGALDEGSDAFSPAVSALGWPGPSSRDSLPSAEAMFERTLDLLVPDPVAVRTADRRQQVLGKVLARYSRFY